MALFSLNRKKAPRLIEGLSDPISHVRKAPYDWKVSIPELAPQYDADYETRQTTLEQSSNIIYLAKHIGRAVIDESKRDFVGKDGIIDKTVINVMQELPSELQHPRQ